MDFMKLGVKSILIPTPGQAEQQELASHLQQSRLALCINQNEFSLASALESAAAFSYNIHSWDMEQYKPVIDELINGSMRVSHKPA